MQARLFGGSPKRSENQIEAELLKFMQEQGWRVTRNHVGLFRTEYGGRVKIGEPGFPDWTFTRGEVRLVEGVSTVTRKCEICHVEAKASTGRPGKLQLEKIAALNHIGELATWTRNADNYKQWYALHFEIR